MSHKAFERVGRRIKEEDAIDAMDVGLFGSFRGILSACRNRIVGWGTLSLCTTQIPQNSSISHWLSFSYFLKMIMAFVRPPQE